MNFPNLGLLNLWKTKWLKVIETTSVEISEFSNEPYTDQYVVLKPKSFFFKDFLNVPGVFAHFLY